MFILFIDDIQKCCHENCTIGLYADDSKIYSTDPSSLQNTLTELDNFIVDRQIRLAANKCQHLTICRKDTGKQFFLEGHCIAKTKVVTDLGIRIRSDLKWNQHISSIRSKGGTRCYQILRSFRSKNIWIYVKAFTTYVRPILETNTVIWSPHFIQDVIRVEAVQRYYIKTVCRRCNLRFDTYAKRLQALNLETLEYRRYKFDIIFIYKIINSLVDLNFNDFFSFLSSPYNLRRHQLCLKSSKYVSDVRKYFFSNRVVNIWNSLPENIVTATSLEVFRKEMIRLIYEQCIR